ncbi:ArsR family transcriptional regulator [Dehalogenimonas lykanthroporepellens BL-DC-9]|nr:ArsR family transcriptional regulator [Dehalogenimonas lykanthroporepellens BL-DC-9]
MTNNRKDLINAYKQRKIIGGVFKVTNTTNGRYLLDSAPDIQARQNAFNFSVTTNNPFDYKMRKDWQEHGASAFTFEILDTLEKKETQSQEQFIEDLKMLEDIQADKLDSGIRY